MWTAFLDRDGTINEAPPEDDYVRSPEDVRLLPGAGEAIRRLNDAGWRTVIVTNQRGIARGLMSEEDLDRVHSRLFELLAERGARVDRIYHCPHEEGECDCRKPGTGMFERARAEDPEVDFTRAVMIGDSRRDVDAGRGAGIRTVSIGSVNGADRQAADLPKAVDWALSLPSTAD